MTFTVYGWLDDHQVTLTWDQGELSGSPAAVVRVHELVGADEHVQATPTGPDWPAALFPAHVALLTIRKALDRIDEEDGDLPEIAGIGDVPDDAVA